MTWGWLVRGMHKWGASAMIVVVFLHMGRVFFFGAYKYPRELTWVTGALLLILTMFMGLTGYLLVWDQKAYWATVVAVNITASAPVIGPVHRRHPARGAGVRAGHAVALLLDTHARDTDRP